MFEDRPDNPYVLFGAWYKEAQKAEAVDPNAFCLATADSRGRPSVRTLLMKGVDEEGFTFYTNLESRKGEELATNPFAALCFYWKSLGRQVRAEGAVERVTDAEADSYFSTRPRESQIGAWASQQSRPLSDRAAFEARLLKYENKFEGQAVPRPPHWSGWRLCPVRIEFWQAQDFRLHHRIAYSREEGAVWTTTLLYP